MYLLFLLTVLNKAKESDKKISIKSLHLKIVHLKICAENPLPNLVFMAKNDRPFKNYAILFFIKSRIHSFLST